MPLGAAVVFTPLHLKDADFDAATVGKHRGRNRGFRQRRAKRDILAVRHHQHTPEFDRLAFIGGQFFHFEFIADDNLVLLAAGFDYCVHRASP